MRTPLTRFHREERAQAIVLVAIVAGVLILGMGIAIDTGQLYIGRRSAQTAADSAAWAGAVVIHDAGTSGFAAATATAARNAAIADAGRNGHVIGAADVNVPPTSGPATGDPGFVEVSVTTQVTTFFFPGPRSVTVRGVAGATRTGTGEAVLITAGTSGNALRLLSSSGRLVVTNGSVFVRSTNTSPGSINIDSPTGGIGITTPASRPTRTRGGVASGDAGKISPAAIVNVAGDPVPDPLANLPAPPTTGCTPSAPSAACTVFPGPNVYAVSATIQPGIYATGITVSGGTITMNAGTYILAGGGLTMTGGSLVVAASAGVLIYNTTPSFPSTGGACGAISFATAGNVTLRPRTTGSFAGLTIFQDGACAANVMVWGGSGTRSLTGTVYMRAGTVPPALRINATTAMAMTGQLIVPSLELSNVRLDLAYDRAWVFGARAPVLVE